MSIERKNASRRSHKISGQENDARIFNNVIEKNIPLSDLSTVAQFSKGTLVPNSYYSCLLVPPASYTAVQPFNRTTNIEIYFIYMPTNANINYERSSNRCMASYYYLHGCMKQKIFSNYDEKYITDFF